MKSKKWISLGKILVVIFTIILFFNAFAAFINIKKDISFYNRAYGLSFMDDYFDNGEYYEIYTATIKNSIVDEEPAVDTSEYEAFGRFYHAYLMARIDDDPIYRKQMEEEKQRITWKKILKVVEELETELNDTEN